MSHGDLAKPKAERNEARLEFVRHLPCLLLREHYVRHIHECSMAYHGARVLVEAHHVYNGGSGGVGIKPDDFRTIPLCTRAHREYHEMGKASFALKYGINLEAHISRINLEFAAQHKPTPRSRKKQAKGYIKIQSCQACGRSHERLSKLKIQDINLALGKVTFMCPVKSVTSEAAI